MLKAGVVTANDSAGIIIITASGLLPAFSDRFCDDNPWVGEWCTKLEGARLSFEGYSIRDRGQFILRVLTADGFRIEMWTGRPVEVAEPQSGEREGE
jgi:hypothetical protein